MSKLRVVETDEHENSVYMFQNIKYSVNLFVDATCYDDAKAKFDLCDFKNRKD